MAYQWNGASMWETVTLPSAVGNYLKLASPLQWQVLLWMATQGRGQGDAAACAAALGRRVSEADCAEALAFWVQEGILQETDKQTETSPQTAAKSVKPVLPTPVCPPRPDVVKVAAKRADYGFLLQEVSARLGKALSPREMEQLADLLTNRGLPAEVVLMAMQYSISKNKRSIGYIVRVAEHWADDGLFTVEQANERLCAEKQQEEAGERLVALLPDEPWKLTLADKKKLAIWFYDWSLSDSLILLAFDRSREKKMRVSYMNRLLESWHAAGLLTPEAVLADEDPNKPKVVATDPAAGGFNLDKYSAMLENHVPTYKGKGE
ncbi:MAG: DnaD domain protein [Clostridia bacterium]|nr:DnaD domain protein [Clostridia bacterium]